MLLMALKPLPHPERERSEQSKDAQQSSSPDADKFSARLGGASRRRLVEALIVIMAGDEFALDQRVERVAAPTPIAQCFIEMDRGALRVAQIEIEYEHAKLARQLLDLGDDAAADAMASRPGRDERAGHRAG